LCARSVAENLQVLLILKIIMQSITPKMN